MSTTAAAAEAGPSDQGHTKASSDGRGEVDGVDAAKQQLEDRPQQLLKQQQENRGQKSAASGDPQIATADDNPDEAPSHEIAGQPSTAAIGEDGTAQAQHDPSQPRDASLAAPGAAAAEDSNDGSDEAEHLLERASELMTVSPKKYLVVCASVLRGMISYTQLSLSCARHELTTLKMELFALLRLWSTGVVSTTYPHWIIRS